MSSYLLQYFVNHYLLDYVKNVDVNSTKAAVLSGKVEFEKLELQDDVLEKLGLNGYSLKVGHVNKLTLQLKIWALASEPAVLTIDGLYILAVPSFSVQKEEKNKAEKKVKEKLSTLTKIEEMREMRRQEETSGSQSEAEDGFIVRQAMAVVRNLQINVSNIHVRLEDPCTDPACRLSMGSPVCSSGWPE